MPKCRINFGASAMDRTNTNSCGERTWLKLRSTRRASSIRGINLTHAAELVKRVVRDPDHLCAAPRIRSYGTENHVLGECRMKLTTGGAHKITYNALNFKKAYYDEYTGELLPEKLVREAIIEELNYFSEEGVCGKGRSTMR